MRRTSIVGRADVHARLNDANRTADRNGPGARSAGGPATASGRGSNGAPHRVAPVGAPDARARLGGSLEAP